MERRKTDIAIIKLEQVNQILGSKDFTQELLSLPESYMIELFRKISEGVIVLDDSISNDLLGSIFNLNENSAVAESTQRIASDYGCDNAYISTNGTTPLNTASVYSLAGEGDIVIVTRDVHVSIHAGLILAGAQPVFVQPEFDADAGVMLPVSAEQIERTLNQHPKAKAVIVTMPTYHGLQGNLHKINELCKTRNIPLMVDEAHGPHYHWLGEISFPISAEAVGADIITQSVHKVFPGALSQGSLALFNNQRCFDDFCFASTLGFQSTSFSFIIFMSVESAIDWMRNGGKQEWLNSVYCADALRQLASSLDGVRVIDEKLADGERVTGIDPTRVTLNVRETGLTGFEIADHLEMRGYIPEMATPDVLLFLISPGKTMAHIEDIFENLKQVLDTSRKIGAALPPFEPPALPKQALTPKQAVTSRNKKRVAVEQAPGHVSAETIGCYPPGSAIITAGEIISEEVITYLKRAVAHGAHLKRHFHDHFKTIEIVTI